MSGAYKKVTDDIVLTESCPRNALSTSLLRTIEVHLGALGISGTRDRHHDVLAGDQIFHRDLTVEGHHCGPPVVAPLGDNFTELFTDDDPLPLGLGQNIEKIFDLCLDVDKFIDDFLSL